MTPQQPTLPILLIRADAGGRLGTGHVMRCLALAQAWQDRFSSLGVNDDKGTPQVVFVCASLPEKLAQRLMAERCIIENIELSSEKIGGDEDAKLLLQIAQKHDTTRIIVDGYQFGTDYQKAVKSADNTLLFFDDYGHCDRYEADFILNQNVYANEAFAQEHYSNRAPYTRLLLGTPFALLRREIIAEKPKNNTLCTPAQNLLIMMGGSDPDGATLRILSQIERALEIRSKNIRVLVGSDNPHSDTIASYAAKLPHCEIFHDAPDMTSHYQWADAAITAGGSAVWELSYYSIPMAIVCLAENQRLIHDTMAEKNAALSLSWHTELTDEIFSKSITALLTDSTTRTSLAQNCTSLVDGNGAARVALQLQFPDLSLRPATMDDARLLFDWANDPIVRANAFHPDPILWDEHLEWWKVKLEDRNHISYIVNIDGNPIAQSRFDITGDYATITVSVDTKQRNRGFGKKVIAYTCERFFLVYPVKEIIAWVKENNIASQKSFVAAGFVVQDNKKINSVPSIRLRKANLSN